MWTEGAWWNSPKLDVGPLTSLWPTLTLASKSLAVTPGLSLSQDVFLRVWVLPLCFCLFLQSWQPLLSAPCPHSPVFCFCFVVWHWPLLGGGDLWPLLFP